MIKLTADQKIALEAELKKAKDALNRNRLCVILGHNEGLSINELAKALRISPSTVCNYLEDYNARQKTKNDPRGGSESKLTKEQSQELCKHLTETTYLKVKHICAYVKENYAVSYSRSGMTAWLEAHGFVYKRPKKVPGKMDTQRQEAFIKEYEALKGSLQPNEEIYFVDAVHPEYQSQAVCGWIKKGIEKTLQSTGQQSRLHIVGAVSLAGMKIFTQEYKTINADAMIDFFKNLENSSKALKIYVILDNARSQKNKNIEKFLEKSRIKIIYLPPYSPNLNPIERLWKIMREVKFYNKYYESAVNFFEEIRSFFKDDIPRMTNSLTSRINDKFQLIKLDPLKIAPIQV